MIISEETYRKISLGKNPWDFQHDKFVLLLSVILMEFLPQIAYYHVMLL